MRIIAVIAAYQKGKALTMRSIDDAKAFVDHVVVVDDGSTDDTQEIRSCDRVTVLRHLMNRGQGAALQTGTTYAIDVLDADIIVHFDADGQMQGRDIPAFIAPLQAGEVDVVLGSRFLDAKAVNMPWLRRVLLRCGTWFTIALSGIAVTDTHNGFRALSRHAAQTIRITLDRMAHASEILDLIVTKNLRYTERPVTISYTPESVQRGQTTFHALMTVKDVLKKKLFG